MSATSMKYRGSLEQSPLDLESVLDQAGAQGAAPLHLW